MKRQEYSAIEKRLFRGGRFLGGHGGLAALVALLVLGGCAPTQVNTITQYSGPVPRPSNVLVYNFAVSPDEVQLDQGISVRIQDMINKTPPPRRRRPWVTL